MTTTEQTSPRDVQAFIETLRSRYVKTARDTLFRSHFDRLLKCDANGALIPEPVVFTATGETRGLAIVDGAGGGKTSLVNHGLRKHPALQPCAADAMPVIAVRVPSPATLKSLGLEVLRESGYPDVSERRERWQIWNLVRQRLRLRGTVVLWIDEAHDLFESASSREISDMLKTLKALMQGEGAVIVILTGIESLWRIASFDDQVKRRFGKIALPAVTSPADGERLWRLIEKFCARAGLEAPERGDLVDRLIHAGRARFGRCIEQIINAIEVALREGATRLEITHFATAFTMQEGCDPGDNVFLAPRWSQIDLDAPRRP